jgi:hypothetical protein
VDNIHEDHQELSYYKDNDYMKFATSQPNHKTLSYNSSKGNGEIMMDSNNIRSSMGMTSE